MTTIEREIKDLKERVAQLESRISQQEQSQKPFTLSPEKAIDREQLRAWLEAEGITVRLPSAGRKQAEHWRKMKEAEKQRHIRLMRELELDPPLSQIIVENRQ